MNKKELLKKSDGVLVQLDERMYTPVAKLAIEAYVTREPVSYENRTQGQHKILEEGQPWGELFDCAWFHFTGTVPAEAAGKDLVALIDVGGEMLLVDQDGQPWRGLTNGSSVFERSLGTPGKRVVDLRHPADEGEAIDLWGDAGCNDLFGRLQNSGAICLARLAVRHPAIRTLYYDLQMARDLLEVLPEDGIRTAMVAAALEQADALLMEINENTVRQAGEVLQPVLKEENASFPLTVHAIGHAHLDLIWLWPVRETIRKGARTLATTLYNMDRYPDYRFGVSQPQLLFWMKEHYPRLYARVKEKILEGRIEPQGVMWVESDVSMPSGESLVRQILFGHRFWMEEFGIEVDYVWLPDVFGYPAALPQIIRKAGLSRFSTQKLSWSLTNRFPYHSYHWVGLDGSSVMAHMLPESTYNSPARANSVMTLYNNYAEKTVSKHAIMAFGIGDGGGGPGEEHLERLARLKNLNGVCPVVQDSASHTLDLLETEADAFPLWRGELYLERHQGTLTTQAATKRGNRVMERQLRDLEWVSVLMGELGLGVYPTEFLTDIWREMLLYQFHDVLPGSSIPRVYEECNARQAEMTAELTAASRVCYERLAEIVDTSAAKRPAVVFNSLSQARREWLRVGDRWYEVTVPAMGWTVIDLDAPAEESAGLTAEKGLLENDVLRVEFSEDGTLSSVWDKVADREVLAEGLFANVLTVYRDGGDPWDMQPDYAEQPARQPELVECVPEIDGPQAALKMTYTVGKSRIEQIVSIRSGSRQINFATEVDWKETASMLRVAFPVDICTDQAGFDVQFGQFFRPTHNNTTWDKARTDVAAHTWADLSESDYGVALLNDCKYGHRVKGSVLELSLIRCVLGPNALVDPNAVREEEFSSTFTDLGRHEFTYALLPHDGNTASAGLKHAGACLNVPLIVVETAASAGSQPARKSWLEVSDADVRIEAVKQAEDGQGVVLRLSETTGTRRKVTLTSAVAFEAAFETDLLERNPIDLNASEGVISLIFKPFEIKTILLK